MLAEDTRRTRILLDRHGIRMPLRSLHAHNEAERIRSALAELARGTRVALVSRRGHAARLRPRQAAGARGDRCGSRGERAARRHRGARRARRVGAPPAPFTFLGFLPRGGRASRALATLRGRRETLVSSSRRSRLGDAH